MEQITMQLPNDLQNAIVEEVRTALHEVIKTNQQQSKFPPYMNQKLAASYLHVAPATLIKWEKRYNDFPVLVIEGTKRYSKASLDKWMQDRESLQKHTVKAS